MALITYIGLLAGALTTFATFPQVVKAWKSKSTHDISLAMYLVLTSGVFLWLIYGIAIGDLPVILANAVTLVLVSFILGLKLKYK
jgi:MtN3 and saliva related transmembrane protein